MMRIMRYGLSFFVLILAMAEACGQGLTLSAIYSDNMMIQAGQPLVLEGSTTPFETVTVSIDKTTKSIKADKDGKWMISFPAFPSGAAFTIRIISGSYQQTIANVLAGEVWLCSGQSNMVRSASATDVYAALKKEDLSQIRYFKAQNDPSQVPLDQLKGKWVICTAENIQLCSAAGLSFAWELQHTLHVPVGIIINAQGGTPIESWTALEKLQDKAYNVHVFLEREQWKKDRTIYEKQYREKLAAYQQALAAAKASGQKPPEPVFPPFQLRDNWNPASLYNALIYPLRHFAFKGVLWYQGESNANYPFCYRYQLDDMIACWRETFNRPDLPFYVVQLPEYDTDDDWAIMRESQATAARLPGVHLVVTLGLGDPLNIHPTRKMEVGRRISLQVLKNSYRRKLIAEGPHLEKMMVEEDKIRLVFDSTGGIRSADSQPIRNMEISGDGLHFMDADVIITGNELVVSSTMVLHPVSVRYSWKNVPESVNFINDAGLPAAPFFAGGIKHHLILEEATEKKRWGRFPD